MSARGLAFVSLVLSAPTQAWAWPSAQGGTIDGSGATVGMALSEDERLLAAVSRDGVLSVWDRRMRSAGASTLSLDGCTRAAGLAFVDDTVLSDRIFVACEAGTLAVVAVERSVGAPTLLRDEDVVVVTAGGDLSAISFLPGDDLVHVVEQSGTVSRVHAVETDGDPVLAAGLPLTFTGTATSLSTSADATHLLVTRTAGTAGLVTRSTGGYTGTEVLLSLLGSLTASAGGPEAPFFVASDTTQGAVVWRSAEGSGGGGALIDGLSGPKSIAWAANAGGPVILVAEDDGGVAVVDEEGVLLGTISQDGGTVAAIVPTSVDEGRYYVASTSGSVAVLQDGPWIAALTVADASLATGEATELRFTPKGGGSCSVRAGGTGTSSSGTSLYEAVCADAVDVVVPLTAEDLPNEGANSVFVFVDDGDVVDVDGIVVTVDLPPSAIEGFSAGAADGAILVAWDTGDEGDIAAYEVFLLDSAFTAEDEPTFEVSRGEVVDAYPLSVPFEDGVSRYEVRIEGLSNGTAYWVAVRAVDGSDQEGPTTTPLSVAPEPTCSAAECAGDTGGCSCDLPQAPASAALVAPCLLAVVASRRRRSPAPSV